MSRLHPDRGQALEAHQGPIRSTTVPPANRAEASLDPDPASPRARPSKGRRRPGRAHAGRAATLARGSGTPAAVIHATERSALTKRDASPRRRPELRPRGRDNAARAWGPFSLIYARLAHRRKIAPAGGGQACRINPDSSPSLRHRRADCIAPEFSIAWAAIQRAEVASASRRQGRLRCQLVAPSTRATSRLVHFRRDGEDPAEVDDFPPTTTVADNATTRSLPLNYLSMATTGLHWPPT